MAPLEIVHYLYRVYYACRKFGTRNRRANSRTILNPTAPFGSLPFDATRHRIAGPTGGSPTAGQLVCAINSEAALPKLSLSSQMPRLYPQSRRRRSPQTVALSIFAPPAPERSPQTSARSRSSLSQRTPAREPCSSLPFRATRESWSSIRPPLLRTSAVVQDNHRAAGGQCGRSDHSPQD